MKDAACRRTHLQDLPLPYNRLSCLPLCSLWPCVCRQRKGFDPANNYEAEEGVCTHLDLGLIPACFVAVKKKKI